MKKKVKKVSKKLIKSKKTHKKDISKPSKKNIQKKQVISPKILRKKKIVIGNWKENPATSEDVKNIISGVKSVVKDLKKTDIILCAPHAFISQVSSSFSKNLNKNVSVGAQDLSVKKGGSFTGEVSGTMIRSVGATYVIIGHSERRAVGETDEIVNTKLLLALQSDLKPIVCVGESVRDDQGEYLSYIKNQIKSALNGMSPKYADKIIIAYEPIWAVGSKEMQTVSPYEMHQMSIFIKKYLIEILGLAPATMVPVVYGGSVTAENAAAIVGEGEADGVLVGRESLDLIKFKQLLKNVDLVK